MDLQSITSAPWVQEMPIKVLIHGYTGDKNCQPNTEIRPGEKKLFVQLTVS